MTVPSEKQIEKSLKELREFIDDKQVFNAENDERHRMEQRIAYSFECLIRWMREDTTGWPNPLELVKETADMIEKKL